MLGPAKELEGVLLVDKPTDHTSHDVVARLRGKLRVKRVGHAGTLDPMATGLLVILVGKATRLSQYLMSVDKEYEGTAELGKVTDSQDAEGEVMETRPVPPLTGEDIAGGHRGLPGRPVPDCRRCIRRSRSTGCRCTRRPARARRWRASRASSGS